MRGSTCPLAPISMPNEAPHIASSQEAAEAQSAQTTSSPVLARNRSYENDGGLSARSRKNVATPNASEAARCSSGRYPRPMKLRAKPASRNQIASAPNEMASWASRENVVAEPSQIASAYCRPAPAEKSTNAAAISTAGRRRRDGLPFAGRRSSAASTREVAVVG